MGKYTVYFEDFHCQSKAKTVKASSNAGAERKFLAWAKKKKAGNMLSITITAIQKEVSC